MQIEKILSANDIGATGAHQAGACIPKKKEMLDFFPKLNGAFKNPRTVIDFSDDSGQNWKFNFIYYNNKFFGGTRNEYRLTGMTIFIRSKNLKEKDKIILSKNGEGDYFIRFSKQQNFEKLIFSNKWKIINI